MTSGHIIVLNFVGATLDEANTSTPTDTTNYPKSNLLGYTHPLRPYRSAATLSTVAATFYIPTGVVVGAVVIDNVNVSKVDIKTLSSGGTSTTRVSGFTLSQEPQTGRYKGFLDLTENGFVNGITADGTAINRFKIQVSSSATRVKSPSNAAEFGSISFVALADMLTFPSGYIQNLDYELSLPQVVNKFKGGSDEAVQIGYPFVSLKLPSVDFLRRTQGAGLFQLIQNRLAPLVFYENMGEPQKFYFMRLQNETTGVKYTLGEVISVPFSLIELL